MYTRFQGGRDTFHIKKTFFENANPEVLEKVTVSGWSLQQRYDQARRYQSGVTPGHRRPQAVVNSGRKISPPAKSGEKADLLGVAPDCREQ